MKKVLAFLLAAAMLCSSLAACSTPEELPGEPATTPAESTTTTPEATTPATAPSEPAPEAGEKDAVQEVNVLWSAEPSVLDIARFLGLVDRQVFYNILEPLTRIEGGVPVGAGAESWEVSEDGLTYTFKLRENYWSDGQKVTANDYITGLKRQADPNNAFSFASDYYCIEGFEAAATGAGSVDDLGLEAPDENTLVMHLTSTQPALLSTCEFYPDRADAAEANGDTHGTEADKILSCGPFVLTEWVHNSKIVLNKNEQYWDAENVALTTANLQIIPDANAQLASFENGSIDYLGVSDADYVAKFQGNSNMAEVMIPSAKTAMVVFNCEDDVFSNTKVRQAFSLALDRDILVEVITGGTATPAYGLIPYPNSVGSQNFRENVAEPLLAVKEANPDPKALLIEGMKELGLGEDPSALTVKFGWGATTAAARTYAEMFQQLWQQTLGVTVELVMNDSATHMSNFNSGDFQMAFASWGSNPEPQFQLSRWATAIGGQSHWINEEYNALVSEASSTVDEAERLAKYAEAEKMLIEDSAIAPLYYMAGRRFYYTYMNGLDNSSFDTVGLKNVYISGKN